jgi:SHS2 domain-containing protein
MGHEVIDVAGDVGIRAWGETFEEAIESAITGMYSLITELDKVAEKASIEAGAEADTPEGLVVRLLNELIFRFDTEGFTGKRAQVELEENRARARVFGEEFDPERHPRGLLLKAATYHNLKVEKEGGNWRMEIIFDI